MSQWIERFTRLKTRARVGLIIGLALALALVAVVAGRPARHPLLAAWVAPAGADTLHGTTMRAGVRDGIQTAYARDRDYYGEEGQFVTQARAMIGRSVDWDSGRAKAATNQDLVCIDIAIIAVQQSGIDIRGKMEADYYQNHRKIREYDHGDMRLRIKRFLGGYNNQPHKEQFYRRIQNVVTYQINQGLYYAADDPGFIPQAGMLIVYDQTDRETGAVEYETHSGVISAVKDGKVTRVILATNATNPPSVQEYAQTELELMTLRGFIVNGYGAWPVP